MPSGITFGNLFFTKPRERYEEYGRRNYFANQPEYSAKAAPVVKVAIYDSPRLMHLVRKRYAIFSAARSLIHKFGLCRNNDGNVPRDSRYGSGERIRTNINGFAYRRLTTRPRHS